MIRDSIKKKSSKICIHLNECFVKLTIKETCLCAIGWRWLHLYCYGMKTQSYLFRPNIYFAESGNWTISFGESITQFWTKQVWRLQGHHTESVLLLMILEIASSKTHFPALRSGCSAGTKYVWTVDGYAFFFFHIKNLVMAVSLVLFCNILDTSS